MSELPLSTLLNSIRSWNNCIVEEMGENDFVFIFNSEQNNIEYKRKSCFEHNEREVKEELSATLKRRLDMLRSIHELFNEVMAKLSLLRVGSCSQGVDYIDAGDVVQTSLYSLKVKLPIAVRRCEADNWVSDFIGSIATEFARSDLVARCLSASSIVPSRLLLASISSTADGVVTSSNDVVVVPDVFCYGDDR